MALDVGDKRIGIAVYYGDGTPVIPIGFILRTTLKSDIAELLKWSAQRCIDEHIIGMPYTISGGVSDQTRKVQRFVRDLARRISLPIHLVDESFTTVEADAIMKDRGEQPSRNRGDLDSMAAALILERFLNG
jgi:putative Holliday junction resolvase